MGVYVSGGGSVCVKLRAVDGDSRPIVSRGGEMCSEQRWRDE